MHFVSLQKLRLAAVLCLGLGFFLFLFPYFGRVGGGFVVVFKEGRGEGETGWVDAE